MPKQHAETERHGGPGASHENPKRPAPDPTVKDPTDPSHLSRHSQISGGGGEKDVHGGHAPDMKRDRQASKDEKAAERGSNLSSDKR